MCANVIGDTWVVAKKVAAWFEDMDGHGQARN